MVRYVIADDAPFVHELIKNILSDLNLKLIGSALNGNEAVELVGKTLPDLIFLDLVMPYKNGLEVAREVKEIWPDLKIIGMSTIDDEKIIQDSKGSGVDEFLEKPFTKESILKILNSFNFKLNKEIT